MAKRKTEATARAVKTAPPFISDGLKLVLFFLIALEAAALGIKAWDENKSAETALLSSLASETRQVATLIDGKVAETRAAMTTARTLGGDPASAAIAIDTIEEAAALGAAQREPSSSRLGEAAELAGVLIDTDQMSGINARGDLVIVAALAQNSTYLAVAPASRLLPPPVTGQRLIITPAATRPTTGVQRAGMKRNAAACAPLGQSSAVVCSTTVLPLFTLADTLRYLSFALLLMAPALAMVGLIHILGNRQAEQNIIREKAEEDQHHLKMISHGAAVGYWEGRRGDTSLWLSEKATEYLNLQREGHYDFDDMLAYVVPDHAERLRETLSPDAQALAIKETIAVNVGGTQTWLEFRGGAIVDREIGVKTGEIGGILIDVTDTRKAIEKMRAAEQRLRNGIHSYSGPFALWDRNKRIVYWNPSFAAIFGLEQMLRPGVTHETVSLARLENVVHERNADAASGSIVLGMRDGTWIRMVERPTEDGGLISVGMDVTMALYNEGEMMRQQRKLKTLVLELEKSEGQAAELARKYNIEKAKAQHSANTKSAFLANMSHELRTPLNAINGFSEIIANQMYGPVGDDRYREYAHDILTSGQHLLDMINDILDIAKIEAGKMTINVQKIDIVDPVDAAVRMVRRKAEEKGISLALQAEDDLPEIDADHRAIRQMVLNLVTNAIKFTDAGGRILVGVKRMEDFIRVSVRDTGVGIPKEHISRLAHPFEQVNETRDRNYEGTGLGLALTKSFAEMHGGRLTIASEPQKGTQVSFYLPLNTGTGQSKRNVA